jgi:uncharacterized protein with von Willebrand factor type A (vWA) domain
MDTQKLAAELVSIADDVMAGSRPERTRTELNQGLTNWVKAYNLMKGYGNSVAAGMLRRDIDKTIKDKDLDSNLVWNAK